MKNGLKRSLLFQRSRNYLMDFFAASSAVELFYVTSSCQKSNCNAPHEQTCRDADAEEPYRLTASHPLQRAHHFSDSTEDEEYRSEFNAHDAHAPVESWANISCGKALGLLNQVLPWKEQ